MREIWPDRVIQELQRQRSNPRRSRKERLRFACICDYFNDRRGVTIAQLAIECRCSERTVKSWIARFRKEAADGLKTRSPTGRPKSIRDKDIETLRNLLAENPRAGAVKIHAIIGPAPGHKIPLSTLRYWVPKLRKRLRASSVTQV